MISKSTSLLRLLPLSSLQFPLYQYYLLELENQYLQDIRCKSLSFPSPVPHGPWRGTFSQGKSFNPVQLQSPPIFICWSKGPQYPLQRGWAAGQLPGPTEGLPTLPCSSAYPDHGSEVEEQVWIKGPPFCSVSSWAGEPKKPHRATYGD